MPLSNLIAVVDRVVFLSAVAGASVATLLSVHVLINAALVRRADPGAPDVPADRVVSVLIPARNEASRIGPTIRSVLASDGVGDLEVIVLDDHSSDETAAVVGASASGDQRLRIVAGNDLPDGWLGKPFACDQLGRLARGSVLVFVDADVVVEPAALRATVGLLDRYNLQLVSPYPRQIVGSVAERVVQPLLQWLWLSLLPLRVAERPRPTSIAAANGQLLAVDAAAWRDVGGHSSVANQVIEDVALAAAFKKRGLRAVVAEGSNIATCRMYTGWSDLRDGYSKSLWAALPNRIASWGVGASLTLGYVVPPAAMVIGALVGSRHIAVVGLYGYCAGVFGRIVSALITRGRWYDSFAHPASVVALIVLARRSYRLRRAGALTWKGRRVGL